MIPLAALLGLTCLALPAAAQQPQAAGIPEAPRELRGVWISSVYNGNWPSAKGLPVAQQQQELIAMMDRAKALNLNAVVFQVRPGGDAMYDSKLEPWSEFLTGRQGQAPQPYYDPLAFAVQEAHKRGLQLHAWFNPYRAATRLDGHFAPNHVSRTMPDATKKLDKLMWLDPGNRKAQDHSLQVILDVVRRYDVDGVQFDDYFYPYASYVEKTGGFPDDDTWRAYQASGGKLSRDDWRRDNVNQFMRRTYESIKQVKPHVLFGISPFGIWRPGNPQGIVGMDPYQQLYADSRLWLNEGWLDYFSPQLYWDLSKQGQSYPKLLGWWAGENKKNRHLWPGISISGVGNGFPTSDIIQRIDITRKQPGATGVIYFSMNPIMKNQGKIFDELKKGPYAGPALVPASRWLDNRPPAAPSAAISRDVQTGGMAIQWQRPADADAFLLCVYARVNNNWVFDTVPVSAGGYRFPAQGTLPDYVAVSLVDRAGNESAKQPLALSGSPASISIPAPVSAPNLPYNMGAAPGAAPVTQ